MAFTHVQKAFMAHIRNPEQHGAPEGIEDRRMAIYRSLFFNNIEGFLASAFPVLKSLYDEEDWLALVRRFFAEHDATSPYFLEISKEFLRYLSNEYQMTEADPPFMLELAHYEWVELDVAAAFFDDAYRPLSDVECENMPVSLSSTARLVGYHFPVQSVSVDFRPEQPDDEQHFIVVYQDADKEVQFLSVNTLTALMLNLIEQGDGLTLNELVDHLSAQLPQFTPQQLAEGAFQTLASLAARQILVTKI